MTVPLIEVVGGPVVTVGVEAATSPAHVGAVTVPEIAAVGAPAVIVGELAATAPE